jgi:hypothetical protein
LPELKRKKHRGEDEEQDHGADSFGQSPDGAKAATGTPALSSSPRGEALTSDADAGRRQPRNMVP